MREKQTSPTQPRDEEGRARGTDAEQSPPQEPVLEEDDRDRIEGRDRPPAGSRRGPSPWLGGG